MPDIVEIGPAWTLIAAPLLLLLAALAACLDRVFVRRSLNLPLRVGFSAPFDEAARLMRQRRRTTVSADRPLWRIGVAGLVVIALLKVSVLPLGVWTVADLSIGVVWFNAMDVMIWAAVWLAGWGANSHFSLVGAYRFLAQALSYELPLMFALTAPAVAASSLRLGDVVSAQQGLWFVVWMPVAFGVFCISVIAFSVWGPFSTAAGTDIAGGVLTEVSGVDRLMLLVGRYALLASGAAFAATLFLGGGSGPVLTPWAWTLVKTVLVLAVFVAVRQRFPAIRPDRFAEVGLLILMPLALLQLLVVSVVVVVGS